MSYRVVLTLAAALGNGSRKQGECLAEVEGVAPDALTDAALDLVGGDRHDLAKLPGTVTAADGVAAIEIVTALRNPRLLAFVPDAPPAPALSPSDDDDAAELAGEPDADQPAEAPKSTKAKRAARKPRK